MIRITIKKDKKKTDLPLRNWGSTACQAKAFGKIGVTASISNKKVANKIFSKSKQKVINLKDKLPKKSIYKKLGYF